MTLTSEMSETIRVASMVGFGAAALAFLAGAILWQEPVPKLLNALAAVLMAGLVVLYCLAGGPAQDAINAVMVAGALILPTIVFLSMAAAEEDRFPLAAGYVVLSVLWAGALFYVVGTVATTSFR